MPKGSNGIRRVNVRSLVFAAIFVAVSLATGYHAYTTMSIGTPAEMGTGFFPLVISVVLALLAMGVGFTAVAEDAEPIRFAPPKALVLVIGAPVVFGLTIRTLGLPLAVAMTVFVAAMASRLSTLKQALIMSICFSIFCVILFHCFLDMPIPLRGRLLGG